MLNEDQQIFEQIKKAENILITFRKTWDGDAVASALALFLFLKKIDKKVEIAAEKFDHGVLFSFLPSYNEIKEKVENLRQFIISLDISNIKVSQIKYQVKDNSLNFIVSPEDGFFNNEDISSRSSGFKYDLIIVLDSSDLESLGKIYDNDTEFFYQTTIINIDHHSGNEEFGQINLVDLNAVSTTEILFSIFKKYSRDAIDENIATCLLAGMISETKSFKTPNVSPSALMAASELISMGARREEIVNYLYRSRPMDALKLWGRVLARLSSELDERLVWSNLSYADFTKTNTTENDLNEVIDELIVNMPKVKIIIITYEAMENEKLISKAIVYSVKNIDALNLVKEYNPIGTKKLARLKTDKPREILEKEVIGSVKEKMEKLLIAE